MSNRPNYFLRGLALYIIGGFLGGWLEANHPTVFRVVSVVMDLLIVATLLAMGWFAWQILHAMIYGLDPASNYGQTP